MIITFEHAESRLVVPGNARKTTPRPPALPARRARRRLVSSVVTATNSKDFGELHRSTPGSGHPIAVAPHRHRVASS